MQPPSLLPADWNLLSIYGHLRLTHTAMKHRDTPPAFRIVQSSCPGLPAWRTGREGRELCMLLRKKHPRLLRQVDCRLVLPTEVPELPACRRLAASQTASRTPRQKSCACLMKLPLLSRKLSPHLPWFSSSCDVAKVHVQE